MGSPVSVVLAEIVMQKIEQLIMPLIADSILFWYRYVDDVVACIKDNQSNVILRTINSINDHIQFTAEEESNSCLNYLDLQIFKNEDGSLKFNIFRKPTHTDKYLDFNSDHPLEHKHSVIRTLVHRAEKLCDDEFKKQEMSHISKILQINGYPMNEINRISKKVTDKRPTMNNANSNVSTDKPSFTSVPYISGISERISRIFKKYDVNIAHLPTRKLKNELCHLKDKRKVGEKAGVVYKLDCKDCDARYVGETGRQVQDRMIEHQRDIANKKRYQKSTSTSAVLDIILILTRCLFWTVQTTKKSVCTWRASIATCNPTQLTGRSISTVLINRFCNDILQHFSVASKIRIYPHENVKIF